MRNFTFMLLRLFLIPAFLFAVASAQVTIHVKVVPQWYTPLLDRPHLAGNFNLWDAITPFWDLTKNPDGTFRYTLNGTQGALVEYLYTRGDWDRVETKADGSAMPIRSFIFNDGQTIVDTIYAWSDMIGQHTATGNTHILDLNFNMPQFGRARRVWVYLPRNYYVSTQKYPVLYMQDGQNLFDEVYVTGADEWAVDESMEALQDSGHLAAIIVAVDSDGQHRTEEYSPWHDLQAGGGDGERCLDWLVNDLKPLIDSYFRTKSGKEHTGIMGSDLGGLFAIYAALERPDVFGKAGVFSPSFSISDSCYLHASDQGAQPGARIYMLAGGQEDPEMIPDMLRMEDSLLAQGATATNLRTVVRNDGEHAEWFWGREFPEAFKWLFADIAGSGDMPLWQGSQIDIYPTCFRRKLFVQQEGPQKAALHYRIIDRQGREMLAGQVPRSGEISLPELPAGIYFAEIRHNDRRFRKKLVHLGE